MGNSATKITPVDVGSEQYVDFLNSLKIPKDLDKTKMVKFINNEFSIFLEDFVVNDVVMDELKDVENGVLHALGTMLVMNLSFDRIAKNNANEWDFKSFLKAWASEVSSKEEILKEECEKFCISDGKFFRYDDGIWVECEKSDIKRNISWDFNFSVETYGVRQLPVVHAKNWVQNKMNECKEIVESLTDNDVLEFLMNLKSVELNQESSLIPCKTKTFDLRTMRWNEKSKSDLFTYRLHFDPVDETTDVTRSFIRAFDCDTKIFASTVLSFGLQFKPILTLIIGPSDSGKSTLCTLAREMYGPFACSIAFADTNFELIRTCFYDKNKLPSEEFIADHKCIHLVVTCHTDPIEIGEMYGGRKVFRLNLLNPIEENNRKVDIFHHMSTRKQMGAFLNWCTENSKYKRMPKMEDIFRDMVFPCTDDNCNTCVHKDDAEKESTNSNNKETRYIEREDSDDSSSLSDEKEDETLD